MNQQKITELIQFLTKNPGYLKRGKENLAALLDSTVEEITEAKKVIRIEVKEETLDTVNDTVNEVKEFTEHLDKLGIKEEDVKSVKFWQTQKGDTRYSIVTKNDGSILPDIEDIIKELTKNIIPVKIKVSEHNNESVLVVFLSDKHIGALTKPEANYSNNYDAKEFHNRLVTVMNEVASVYSQKGPLDKMVVVDLGDAMDGYNAQTTRGGHTLPQNMTNKEAFEVFIDTHKAFYNALLFSGFAKDYEFYHITNSNHGGEFEHFATRCLQEYLRASYKGIKFEIFDKFITPVTIGKHTYLLTHGKDEEDMKLGLPLTLDSKTEQYILNYILHHKIPTDNLHFIKGDLHQASTQWGKHFRYRNVPSVYGSSKWIMTNYGYTKPGCSFDLIEGDKLSQWELWF